MVNKTHIIKPICVESLPPLQSREVPLATGMKKNRSTIRKKLGFQEQLTRFKQLRQDLQRSKDADVNHSLGSGDVGKQ